MKIRDIPMPQKEQVEKLLEFIINDPYNHIDNIEELLGLKWIDTLMHETQDEINWGYNELEKFFQENGIFVADAIEEALEKLKE